MASRNFLVVYLMQLRRNEALFWCVQPDVSRSFSVATFREKLLSSLHDTDGCGNWDEMGGNFDGVGAPYVFQCLNLFLKHV